MNKSKNYIRLSNSIYWLSRSHRTTYKRFRNNPWLEKLKSAQTRCRNKDREYYGGKGIRCLLTESEIKYLWFRDKAWFQKIPSLDRKNSDGNYTFENCQFIEMSENGRKASKMPRKYRDRVNHGLVKYTKSVNPALDTL